MNCLDHSYAELFVLGQLSDEVVSQIEGHLDCCNGCMALVARVAGSGASEQTLRGEIDASPGSTWMHLLAALAVRSSGQSIGEGPAEVLPEQIGRYRILDVLGRGSMGVVYRAVDVHSNRLVAIKTVVSPAAVSLAAIRQEISFLKRQQHPGLVRVLDDGLIEGDPWYAMELLIGQTLAEFQRSLWQNVMPRPSELSAAAGGRLDEVLLLVTRMCAPLSFVHRAGVVHCDLKPANVFIRDDNQPILMDFGLLSIAGGAIGRERLEVGGYLRGTLPYLSPEVIRGRLPDARADLYALGCILYELVTGRPPFIESTITAFAAAHLHSDPIPASQLVSGVPPKLDELLAGLLAKRVDQRVGDAALVAEQLRAVLRSDEPPAPQSDSPPHLFRPRMVGRDAVMDQIRRLRTEAAAGRGSLLLIGGESGIGKTFLGAEAARLAARSGFDIVIGECTAFAAIDEPVQEISVPALGPFRNTILHAADQCRACNTGAIPSLFGTNLTVQVLAKYEPILNRFLSTTQDDLPQLPPPAERERTLRALHELVANMATRMPLLLVLDDLQWADDLSLAFLESMSSDFLCDKRILILALYRSEEVPDGFAKLKTRKSVKSVMLTRLDLEAVTSLVGDLLSNTPEETFVQALAAHSEGNPFFVAEYLRAAVSEGVMRRTAQGWRLSQDSPRSRLEVEQLSIPRSLRDLLERRLGLLSEGSQRAAEAASVLGREFDEAMLSALIQAPAAEVRRCVNEMVKRQLAERVSATSIRFAHDKTRESAYRRIDADRRRGLHRVAASVIQSTFDGTAQMAAHYAELAYHFRHAGDSVEAANYFEKAGEDALRTSANADAARYFGDAIAVTAASSIPVDVERRASWERRVGDALQGLGDLSGSKERLLRAVTLLGWPVPNARPGLDIAIARRLVQQILHRSVPRRWFAATPENCGRLLEAARAYDRLMQIYYYLGEYKPLFHANLTTVNLAERVAPSPILAAAYTNAAAVAGIVPLRRIASLYFQLAEATLEKAYDAEVESYYRLLYAHYLSGLGEWTMASEAAQRGLELATQLGFRRRWEDGAAVFSNLGWGRNFDDCLVWGDRMLESAAARGDLQMTSWGLLRRAEIHVARREHEAADTSLTEAEKIVSQLGLPERIRALGLRAFLLLRSGKLPEAVTMADRAAELVRQAKTIHAYCIEPYSRIAEVHLAAWEGGGRRSQPALLKARASCATLKAAARIFPIAIPRYCLHEGTLAWLGGRKERARNVWNRGRNVARKLSVPYDAAVLTLTLAQTSGESASAAQEALRELDRLGVRNPVENALLGARLAS